MFAKVPQTFTEGMFVISHEILLNIEWNYLLEGLYDLTLFCLVISE